MEFRSRAVLALVELHEQELHRFLDVWEQFLASGRALPEDRGDPDYQDPDHLCAHVLMAARSYLTWIGDQVGRPVEDVDRSSDPHEIAPRLRKFAEALLAAYRRQLVHLDDKDLKPLRPTKWGIQLTIEAMLEHAVVHPMRHRVQLERIGDSR